MDQTMARLANGDAGGDAGGGGMSRADWIGAARALLVAEGIEAVKILRLADRLGVSRGSFYWHFTDRADLLEALLALWTRQNTRAVIDAADGALDLTAGILGLFDVWVDTERFDPVLDGAVRDWARRSPKVRRAVEKADAARIKAIAELFARDGYGATEAFIRARIIYFTQVGYYALGIHETLGERFSYIESYFTGFTGRVLPPEVAAAYRARLTRRRGHLQARRPRRSRAARET